MIIGMRTAAWAKSGYTAKDYVQDGLIAMWDGIENAGWGIHDPNAAVWKCLTNAAYDGIGKTTFTKNSLILDGTRQLSIGTVPSDSHVLLEIVIDPTSIQTTQFVYANQIAQNDPQCAFVQYGRVNFGHSLGAIHCSVPAIMGCHHYAFDLKQKIAYVDGIRAQTSGAVDWWTGTNMHTIGGFSRLYFNGKIHAIRVYSCTLDESQIMRNFMIDHERFA